MKIGAALPFYWGYDSKAVIDHMACTIEDLGFDSLWLADHIVMPEEHVDRHGAPWFEGLCLASYLAVRTKRVAIGFDVLVVPYREPVFTAKALATIDNLSDGRLIVGVGTGHYKSEFAALGVPFQERGARHNEYLRVYKAIWTQQNAKFDGRFVHFSNIRTDPMPVQKPHPPIWVGGTSDAAIRRAAELGDGWQPVGISLGDLERGMARIKEMARKAGRNTAVQLCYSGYSTHIFDGPPIEHSAGLLKPSVFSHEGPRYLLDGNVEQVLGDLKNLKKVGCSHVIFRLGRADSNKEQMTRELALVSKHILPEVRRWA